MATTEQSVTRPYTGAEYLESIRDSRTIYFHGERVKDVTTHPAFRNSARSVARLYDALHDPDLRDALTCPTDTGSGGVTHKFFRVPKSADDLVAARDAIVAWQRLVYGWMGRSPDYKASFLGTLGANGDYYGEYKPNARALVPAVPGAGAVLEPRHHPPARRPPPPRRRDRRRLHARREGDRQRHRRLGGQGRRHGIGAHALQLHRPLRARTAAPPRVRHRLRRRHGHAGREAPLPELLRAAGGRRRQPVRLPAVEPARRERLDPRVRQRPHPVGERVPLRRHGEGRQLLPGHRVHPTVHVPRSRPPLRQGGLHLRRAVQGAPGHRDERVPGRAGTARRGDRLAHMCCGACATPWPAPRTRGSATPCSPA